MSLAKQRAILVLWMLAFFLSMCALSEALRRDFHRQNALLHCPGDLCPENWK